MAPILASDLGDVDDVSGTESKDGGAERNDEEENTPEGKKGGGKRRGRHFVYRMRGTSVLSRGYLISEREKLVEYEFEKGSAVMNG